MGKKKKPIRPKASSTEACELEEGSAAWLEEQRRLLEQYQNAAGNNSQSGAGSRGGDGLKCQSTGLGNVKGSDAELLGSALDPVVEQQRRLLEQTSQGGSSGSTAHDSKGGEVFSIRRVPFVGRSVPVLLQNRNGPCSLLAVANALLLRGTLQLGEKEDFLTSADLVSRLAKLCESLNAKAIQEDANARKAIQDLVERLPKFMDGLDVNVRFSGCSDFEYTEDLALFDCFDLQVFHVWVDPKVAEVANGWNTLAERLVICDEIRGDLEKQSRPPTPAECEKLAKAVWLEEWLEETRPQVTPLGCQGLMDAVKYRQVCVLFRCNHFTTVFKPSSDALCSLLTDASFESEESAVWETIELNGSAGNILDGHFSPSAGSCSKPPAGANLSSGDRDRARARADLLQIVQEMGFSREQAEAGLAAVNWVNAEEAIEALLESSGDLPAPSQPGDAAAGFSQKHRCSTCGKDFKSFNGLLNHRAAKSH